MQPPPAQVPPVTADPTVTAPSEVPEVAQGPWPPRSRNALVAVAITCYGLVVWLPFEVHATFFLDDLSFLEHYRLGTWFPSYRPTFRVEMGLAYRLFGSSPTGYYVLLGLLCAGTGALLYLVLRQYGLGAVPAAIAGVALITFPRADSTALWWSDMGGTALFLGLGGLWLGAIWLHRSGWALRWLVPSLLCLVAAVLCYDSLFPIVVLPACFVLLAPDRRRLFAQVGASAVAAAGAAFYMFLTDHGTAQPTPAGHYLSRGWQLARGAWQAFVVHGFNTPSASGSLFVLAIAGVIGVVVWATRRRQEALEPLLPLVGTVGLLIVGGLCALVPYLPANPFYVPTLATFGNRVNVLVQVFCVCALSLAIWVVARLLAPRSSQLVAAVLAAAMAVVVLGGFVGQVRTDQHFYQVAGTQRAEDLAAIVRADPHPATGSNILLGDYPTAVGPPTDVAYPTIYDQWDAAAILELQNGTATLNVAPLNTPYRCEAGRVVLPADGVTMPYGRTVVVDVDQGVAHPIDNAHQCAAVLPRSVTVPGS